jgi:pilus assembly protein CpaF
VSARGGAPEAPAAAAVEVDRVGVMAAGALASVREAAAANSARDADGFATTVQPMPPLSPPQTRVSTHLVDRVRTRLASAPTRPNAAAILEALRAEGCLLDGNDLLRAADQVRSELTGAGVLDQFLGDPTVTDVLVNAPDSVWVERAGVLARTAVHFPDEASVRRLAQRLAAQAGRRLDDAAPCVDAVLPGGTRLHAVLPPVAVRGTLISLRVPPRRAFSVEQLIGFGMVTPLGARLLVALARARVSFLISGGTGTGKTTVLGTLLGLVSRDERIVIAEECAELVSTHPHIARLQCRSANQEGVGGVGLRTLVRQALRMRPDRVVVGEVRGAEVCDLLTAMNTGHEGGCATLHANGLAEVPARVEALAAPSGLSRGSVHAQLGAGVRVVVHLVRENGGRRRLASVGVLRRDADGWARVVPAVMFGADGTSCPGPAAAQLEHLLGIVLCPDPGSGDHPSGGWQEALEEADRRLPVVDDTDLAPLPQSDPAASALGSESEAADFDDDAEDDDLPDEDESAAPELRDGMRGSAPEPFVADYGPRPESPAGVA